MMSPGLVNLDFADIRTVMAEMGKAMMGTGEAEGENRAIRAAEAAISNPLLEDTSMAGARGLLINITGGEDMTLFEVDQAANRIREEVADDANIIFGSAVDENLSGRVRVSVVATGIDIASQVEAQRPRLVAVGGGGAAQAVAPQQAAPATPSFGNPSLTPSQPAPAQMLNPRPVEPAYAPPAAEPTPAPAPAPSLQPSRSYVPPAPAPRPASANHRSTIFTEPSSPPAPAPVSAPVSPARSLFGIMTRGMRGRPVAAESNGYADRIEPQRAEPTFPHSQPTQQASSQVQQPTDEALEIPAFLRRQTS
jgi:cell division protein FtsZ